MTTQLQQYIELGNKQAVYDLIDKEGKSVSDAQQFSVEHGRNDLLYDLIRRYELKASTPAFVVWNHNVGAVGIVLQFHPELALEMFLWAIMEADVGMLKTINQYIDWTDVSSQRMTLILSVTPEMLSRDRMDLEFVKRLARSRIENGKISHQQYSSVMQFLETCA